MNTKKLDTLLIGAALFAMFFGAGNLIFPTAIGLESGNKWIFSLLGFISTGIGLPVLGIIAVAKSGGTIDLLTSRVHPLFSTVISSVIILAIGPLLAIPRTCATVFEIGIQPLFKNSSPILISIVYFSITLFFVIKPSGVIDKIGKILTPILLFVISAIIIKGILQPIGTPVITNVSMPFSLGFTTGYQTLDALGSIVMAGILLMTLVEKGYTNKNEQVKMTIIAGLIAGLGLLIVYSGLLYLGACSSEIYPLSTSKTELIINITSAIFGNLGQISLCIVISAACLTTAIGLTAVVGNYFSNLSGNKISYKFIVIVTSIFSAFMSINGVDEIIKLAIPMLVLVYPIIIVLIILGIVDQFIKNSNVYKGAVLGAFIVGVMDSISAMGIHVEIFQNINKFLPLSSSGFSWVLPASILGLLGLLLPPKNDHVFDYSNIN